MSSVKSPSKRPSPLDELLQSPGMHELLHSNNYPSDFEAACIRDKRAECSVVLRKLEEQISQAEAALDLLRKEKEQLVADNARWALPLQSIRRLPRDILCDIFLACEENLWDCDSAFLSLTMDSMNWVTSQVCRTWRDAALSFPRFWTQVVVDLDMHRNDNKLKTGSTTGIVSLLELYLHRSIQMPLSVCIVWKEHTRNVAEHPLIQTLFPSSTRWEILILMCDTRLHLLDPLRGSLPLLRNLFIAVDSPNVRDHQCF